MDFVDTMRSHCSSAFSIDYTTSEAHDSLIVVMFREALEKWGVGFRGSCSILQSV